MADRDAAPTAVLAERMRAIRQRRRLSAREVADRIAQQGGKLGRASIAKIEVGERGVTVDEVFLIAAALDVSPTNLLLPAEPMAEVAVTPKETVAAVEVREWIYGQRRLRFGPVRVVDEGEEEAFYAEAPEVERLARRVQANPAVRQTRVLLEVLERVLEAEDGRRRGGRIEADHLRDTAPRVRQLAEFVAKRAELLADEIDAEVQARRDAREDS